MIDKFRQDRHFLHPTWQDVYQPQRANIEGLNGRAKAHGIDISDPSKRLAHGRVAQAILLALMICSVNLAILHSWRQTTGTQSVLTSVSTAVTAYDHETHSPIPATRQPGRAIGHRLEHTPETPRSRPASRLNGIS
ncbi:hypothetical protein [Streptomyces sp. NPDC048349]|uniref:hypothetical protein n=1 Tax=Streptomyces sp. NPDC048349 TaxID=3155486 RepID=UPI0034191441